MEKNDATYLLFESMYKKLEADRADAMSALVALMEMKDSSKLAIREGKSLSAIGLELLQKITMADMCLEILNKYFTEKEE